MALHAALIGASIPGELQATELVQVIKELRANIQPIRSIEYRVERDITFARSPIPQGMGDRISPDAKLESKSDYFYYWSGGKFRVDFNSSAWGTESTAFDGSNFQLFRTTTSHYVSSPTIPQMPETPFPSPLVWAYFWLIPIGEPIRLESLLHDDTWLQLHSSSRLSDRKRNGSQSLPSLVVERESSSGKRYIYRVDLAIADNGGVFPISWTSNLKSSGETTYEVVVTGSMQVEIDGGSKLTLPVSVRVESFGSNPSVSNVSADEKTVRVNHTIANDTFEISPSAAKIVQYIDRSADDSQPLVDNPISNTRAVSILITLVVVIGLAVAVINKRLRKRQQV